MSGGIEINMNEGKKKKKKERKKEQRKLDGKKHDDSVEHERFQVRKKGGARWRGEEDSEKREECKEKKE